MGSSLEFFKEATHQSAIFGLGLCKTIIYGTKKTAIRAMRLLISFGSYIAVWIVISYF